MTSDEELDQKNWLSIKRMLPSERHFVSEADKVTSCTPKITFK